MAITASAQSALQDLSWDDTIVPTLRKRLQSESRAISKRMSTISVGSGEDGTLPYTQIPPPRVSSPSNKAGGRTTPSSMNNERPSAIPRPSLNYSRPTPAPSNANASQVSSRNDKKPFQQRSRTYSQPFRIDAALASAANGSNGHSNGSTTRTTNALPTPVSSRSNSPILPPSPALEARDARSTKASEIKHVGQTTPTFNRPMLMQDEYNNQERWDADEETYDASYSSINVDVARLVKQNGILHEAPPFSANSSFASEIDERPSLEERPFEHWYRGDLSRNGGVGELRVGSRRQMLEIASYGHKLRKVGNDTMSRQRRRAESIGHRESLIFTEGHDNLVPMVLDEAPLTDMEADTELETDREQSFSRIQETPLEQPKRANYATGQSTVPPSTPRRGQASQIPRATPSAPRTTKRTASEPLHAKSLSVSTSSMPPSRSRSPTTANGARIPNGLPQSVALAAKRGRAKSPAVTPASKKPRPSAAQQKRSKSTAAGERLRPSDASDYPDVPEGTGSMADAIPSWTQPKKAGNWDDVVLPVVARKMGLEDQYEEADGSPKADHPSEEVVPPQPGTFGYDPSKRRQRYDPATGEEIPMDEFDTSGKSAEGTSPTRTFNNENWTSKRFSKATGNDSVAVNDSGFKETSRRYSPPPSPAPFEHYKAQSTTNPKPEHETAIEDEKHGVCCGCIIM